MNRSITRSVAVRERPQAVVILCRRGVDQLQDATRNDKFANGGAKQAQASEIVSLRMRPIAGPSQKPGARSQFMRDHEAVPARRHRKLLEKIGDKTAV
jgi:hypothetical protein